jgi:aldose 1-epimerase
MSKKIELRILEEVTVPIALDVFTKGLTVHKLQLDTAAVAHDIVPGPYDEEDVPTKYVNTIIGRYSNRVPVSSEGHTINKGGHTNNVKPIANGTKCFSCCVK